MIDPKNINVDYSLDNPVLMAQFDALASWAKSVVNTLEDKDIQTVGKSHPDSQYVLAMCAMIGKFDPMLTLHIGNVTMFWTEFIRRDGSAVLKLLKMTALDRMTLLLRALVEADEEQTRTIQMLLYAVDVFTGHIMFAGESFDITKSLAVMGTKEPMQKVVNQLKEFVDSL